MAAAKPEPTLSLEGALDLLVGGAEAHIEAQGNHLRLDLNRPRAFWRALHVPRAGRLGRLRRLARFLFDRGLTLRVVSRNRQILVLGRDAATGTVSRVLRVPYMALGKGKDLMRVWAG